MKTAMVQLVMIAGTSERDLTGLRKRKLAFMDERHCRGVMKAGAFDLIGMLRAFEVKAKEIHATRIVLDGTDVPLNLLDEPAFERRCLHVHRKLFDAAHVRSLVHRLRLIARTALAC